MQSGNYAVHWTVMLVFFAIQLHHNTAAPHQRILRPDPNCLLYILDRVPTNLELSGNFVNLEKSGNLRYGQGIFYDMSHGSRIAYR